MTAAEHESDLKLTTDNPYPALTGELWGNYCEVFRENWPRFLRHHTVPLLSKDYPGNANVPHSFKVRPHQGIDHKWQLHVIHKSRWDTAPLILFIAAWNTAQFN